MHLWRRAARLSLALLPTWLLVIAVGLGLPGCVADDETPAPVPSGTSPEGRYLGGMAGSGDVAGVLDVTVARAGGTATSSRGSGVHLQQAAPSTDYTLSGTVTLNVPGVGPVALTGTLNGALGQAQFSGGALGGVVTFRGTLVNNVLSGTFAAPAPYGSGPFALTLAASGSDARLYCGSFDGMASGGARKAGRWMLFSAGTLAGGAFAPTTGDGGLLAGTRDGAEVTLQIPPRGEAHGTVAGGDVSGTWSDGAGGSGTFRASEGECSALPPPAPQVSDAGADGGRRDGGVDASVVDAGVDAGGHDAGPDGADATVAEGGPDATVSEGGTDAAASEGGTDASELDGGVEVDATTTMEAGDDSAPPDGATSVDGGSVGVSEVVHLSEGNGQTRFCAVVARTARGTAGEVWCWGTVYAGAFGDGFPGARRDAPSRIFDTDGVTPVADAIQVAVGPAHACFLRSNGTVWCWGVNGHGELGDNGTADQATPQQVVGPRGQGTLTNVVGLAAGGFQKGYTCALDGSGAVACWGTNDYAQLASSTAVTFSNYPRTVANLGNVTQVVGGLYHVCAIRGGLDGALLCWGNNADRVLGNAQVTGASSDVPVQVILADGQTAMTGVTAASAGNNQTCAIAQGTLSCWGYNAQGLVGNGTTSPSVLVPTEVVSTSGAGTLSGMTGVAAAASHTCAYGAAGTYCFGQNHGGYFGNGTTSTTPTGTPVASSFGPPTFAPSRVVAGSGTTCGISSKAVWCWGANTYGAVGALGDSTEPLPVSFAAPSASP